MTDPLGVQAYIYGFPWLNLAQYRWVGVTQPPTPDNPHEYAPLNQFYHARILVDSSMKQGGAPNNDTLYSMAWLNLSSEPLILSVPAMPDRYYSVEMTAMDSDNFAYVGTRTTGTSAGNYLIAGPDWSGPCPTNVIPVEPARTPSAVMLIRTLVYDSNDLSNVHAIQDQYRLTPLSCWGTTNQLPDDRNVWMPFPTNNDALAVWKTINRAMTENPPNVPSQQSLVNYFAQIGIGPGMSTNVDLLDEATQRGLRRAAVEGQRELVEAAITHSGLSVLNGWIYPPRGYGRCGQHDDFFSRAAYQTMQGLISSDAEEGTYIEALVDSQGQRLSGAYNYTITFPSNGLPDVDAFWSITMYGFDNNLVDNPINRYKIGSYPTTQLTFNADGTLTIYVQNTSPGADKESNWLPAPTNVFYVMMRCYMPGSNIVDQTWAPPAVSRQLSSGPTLGIEVVDSSAILTWTSPAGFQFQVEHVDTLPVAEAIPWLTVPGEVTSADGNYRSMTEALATQQFYRVRQLP